MGGHIRLDKDLADDPRMIELAEIYAEHLEPGICQREEGDARKALILDVCRNALLGVTYKLWRYADTHIHSDNTLNVTLTQLAYEIKCPLAVMKKFPREWLVVRPNGRVILPDYVEKNALIAKEKRREQGRDRVARYRARQAAECNADGNALQVTQSNGRNAPSRARARARVPNPYPNPSENSPQPPDGGQNGHAAARERSPERQRKDASRAAWTRAELARKANDFVGLQQREPLIAEAIRLIGGFQAIGMTNTDRMPQVRTRFREFYEQLLERQSGEEG